MCVRIRPACDVIFLVAARSVASSTAFCALLLGWCVFVSPIIRELDSALARKTEECDRLTQNVTSLLQEKAGVVLDGDRLRLELAAVREELAGTKSAGSSSNEQLRQKSEELMRCEAARATAEALVAELRNSVAEAKVGVTLVQKCGNAFVGIGCPGC